ncbi:hypothetical protein BDR04DRAFT_1098536, partial [Suillus decipiens]
MPAQYTKHDHRKPSQKWIIAQQQVTSPMKGQSTHTKGPQCPSCRYSFICQCYKRTRNHDIGKIRRTWAHVGRCLAAGASCHMSHEQVL